MFFSWSVLVVLVCLLYTPVLLFVFAVVAFVLLPMLLFHCYCTSLLLFLVSVVVANAVALLLLPMLLL